MRYFVTGGAGFIGSNYVNYLLNDVEDVSKVTVYDNLTYASNIKNLSANEKDPRFNFIKGDICDYEFLKHNISNHDVLVNFAAESHVDRSILDSRDFVQTNLLGTNCILEASRLAKISKIVQISTDEVYGSRKVGSFTEEDALAPNSPYAASKAGADLLCRSYSVTHDMDIRITRSCNNYGLFQYPEKVIPVFINAILNEEELPIYGSGNNIREWIHVSDNCQAIQMVLESGSKGEIYNIGSGWHLSNNELASKILESSKNSRSKIKFIADRKGHDFRYSVNFEKISKLGFRPKVDFLQGLEMTIAWYENNRNWWNR